MALKICFRGDDREPLQGLPTLCTVAHKPIFEDGFRKRKLDMPIMFKSDNEAGLSINIESVTGVCVSGRLGGAALFPLYEKGKPQPVGPNYMYMMAIDTKNIVNTHKLQVDIALMPASKPFLATQPNDVMVWLCADELAVDEVPTTSIIAAVGITRAFLGEDWKKGGTYTLVNSIWQNGECTVPNETRETAIKFLGQEWDTHRTDKLPSISSGFHESTKT
jgi:hypothetical protein